jgi:hypothetical protein
MKSIRIGIGQEYPTDIGKGNNSLIFGVILIEVDPILRTG